MQRSGRYTHSLGLQLLLPVIPFGISVMSAGIAWSWSKLVSRRDIFGVSTGFMCETTDDVKEYLLDWCAIDAYGLSVRGSTYATL
jgi:hypothetical protein